MIEKLPLLSVVTAEDNIDVDAPAMVVVFTEYIWMVAPEMGCCPPCTAPEIAGRTEDVAGGPLNVPKAHPERRRLAQERAKVIGRRDALTRHLMG